MASIAINDGLSALRSYWQAKRGERNMPARKDIDPIDIPRLLPHVVLYEAVDRRLRCRLCGSAVAEAYGRDPTGKFLDELVPKQRLRVIYPIYKTVMETARPMIGRGNFKRPPAIELTVTRLLLPLSEDGTRVSMILEGVATESPLKYMRPDFGSETEIDPDAFEMEFV